MNQIIKFIERDEILKLFPEVKDNSQYLLGFFRKSEDYVVYCSIVKEDDGTFEYFYNCNRDVLSSLVPDNNFRTFDECKEAMIKDLKGFSCNPPSFWGVFVNEATFAHQELWKHLEIKGEYPSLYYFMRPTI